VREVSCRATRILLEGLEQVGIDPERQDWPAPLATLRDPQQRVSWATMVAVLDVVAAAVEGRITLLSLGRTLAEVPAVRVFVGMLTPFAGADWAHLRALRWSGTAMMPVVKVDIQHLANGAVAMTGRLDEGFPGCAPYFALTNGLVLALSERVLGQTLAFEAEATPHRGRLVLGPARRRSLAARAVDSARSLLSLGNRVAYEEHRRHVDDGLAALLDSRRSFHAVLERMPVAVGIHRGGHWLWANDALAQLVGLHRGVDLVGGRVGARVHADDQHIVAEQLRSTSPTAHRELRLHREDGTLALAEISHTDYVDFGGAPARIVVATDVSESKRMQEQLLVADRMASLGMIAASVAHEINNPLAYAVAHVDVAQRAIERGRTSKASEVLTTARDGLERVRGIVLDLKTFSRPDAVVSVVDLHEVLDATVALARKQIEARARLVRYNDATLFVRANRARLGQVFLNLILNAVEALPEGGAREHVVSLRTYDGDDGTVMAEVGDDGVGIPGHLLERVFEPFFTTKPIGTGTGLGLAICHRIVTELGGAITVVPGADGLRTVFRVTLPGEPAGPVSSTQESKPPSSTPRRRRVLAIDDEPFILSSLGLILGDTHEVVAATDGPRAITLLEEDAQFDVILCDLMMHGMDGIGVYDAVQRLHPGLERRIVFMTGGVFSPRVRMFLGSVQNRCLDKPFDEDGLRQAVER